MKIVLQISAIFYVVFIIGCAKPDKVLTVNSPSKGVFYTIETTYGHGALESNATDVYAHLESNGSSKRILVLSGLYLDIDSMVWTTPYDIVICMPKGLTNTFRNEVTLIAGDASITIHNHLLEQCAN